MKLFVDTGNLKLIYDLQELGILNGGITINPKILRMLELSYSKSFKGILIGKMSNLLDTLDLPESVSKDIRMFYRKMFPPKHNLNRSKEIDDFRKKVESPNSKYFDDFDRIRNHVLLHGKNNKNIKDRVSN